MSKETTQQEAGVSTEAPAKSTKKKGEVGFKSVIIGLCMALVVASIAWSTYTVGNGLEWETKAMIFLAPQALFAGSILATLFILAFAKILK